MMRNIYYSLLFSGYIGQVSKLRHRVERLLYLSV